MEIPLVLVPNGFGFNFDNSYLQLPPIFYKKQLPTAVKNPQIIIFNDALALTLGLNADVLKNQGADGLSGNALFIGSEPIAQAYAGHQFGHFNMLGDGRAILLGEHVAPTVQRVDIQLKGSGRTPYSRSGDGRAALAPMLREYLISEAMFAFGIPTTRSLAVTTTGEHVYRDGALAGAVLTRVAASHLRIGTFQFAASRKNLQQLQALADYSINRHFPEIVNADNKYLELLKQVITLQASLIAQWMHVGFVHGVMNTDNISICGETIDYGPCAFMNTYLPETAFSSIDTGGRYAFANQPNIAHWNLIRLAETLLALIDKSEEKAITLATECLNAYPVKFFDCWHAGMCKKLGIFNAEAEDTKLVEDFLMHMQNNKADYTNTFRLLATEAIQVSALYEDASFRDWLEQWKARLTRQAQTFDASKTLMNNSNPKVIPRNHLVEDALSAAENSEMSLFNELLNVLSDPYADLTYPEKYTQSSDARFESQYKTYCGT
ncbi:MAG: YdiU family protein [Methylotenera sp.]|nr:YdiU family protein [Methylotenera sp.]